MNLSGFGLGFRPQHYKIITDTLPAVDWFEIITENFMGGAPRPRKFLEKLRSHYPIATHGVGLSITSLEPIDRDYLKSLTRFVSWLEPKIVSDHLCWTSHKGRNSHDLLPTPYTKLNLDNVISKINQVQDVTKHQFVFENPSAYVAFSNNEMSEANFFSELVKKTGCGVLLDINNAYVNWKNLGWEPLRYFFDLPRDSVKQFHLAGHSVQNGILIDTHDHPVTEGVMDLYKKALDLWPNVPTLLEWDEKIPEFEVLLGELSRARNVRAESKEITIFKKAEPKPLVRENLKSVYGTFFENITGSSDKNAAQYLRADLPVQSTNGIGVYSNAYFLRLENVLKDLLPTLAWIAEEDGFHDMTAQYLKVFPPQGYSINQIGQNMPEFLNSQSLEIDLGVHQSVLRDLAKLDLAYVEVFETPGTEDILKMDDLSEISAEDWESVAFLPNQRLKIIDLEWDVGPAWKSVKNGEDPQKPTQEDCSYLVWTKAGLLQNQKLPKEKKIFLGSLLEGKTFKESVLKLNIGPGEGTHLLAACISDELITSLRRP